MTRILTTGCYPHVTNEEYHAAKEYISRSAIMDFAESPYKYWANYLNPYKPARESTKAMEFGSAFHTYVLEPEKFDQQYVIEPEKVLLKDVGRDEYEDYKLKISLLEKDNRICLSISDVHLMEDMCESLMNHPEASQLIEGAKYEQSYFWQDQESGLFVKSRPDILHDNMIVDLKTCASASFRAYQRSMVDGGYHVQGAMCREAIKVLENRDIPNVINICIEKSYPYEIGIKVISESALESGRKFFKDKLIELKECMKTNSYPSYDIQTVELPAWAT